LRLDQDRGIVLSAVVETAAEPVLALPGPQPLAPALGALGVMSTKTVAHATVTVTAPVTVSTIEKAERALQILVAVAARGYVSAEEVAEGDSRNGAGRGCPADPADGASRLWQATYVTGSTGRWLRQTRAYMPDSLVGSARRWSRGEDAERWAAIAAAWEAAWEAASAAESKRVVRRDARSDGDDYRTR